MYKVIHEHRWSLKAPLDDQDLQLRYGNLTLEYHFQFRTADPAVVCSKVTSHRDNKSRSGVAP